MPKYLYICKNCDAKVDFFHSMTEKMEDCEFCEETATLERIPSKFNTVDADAKKQVGDVVKRSIKDIRDELQQEKEKLSNEFYN